MALLRSMLLLGGIISSTYAVSIMEKNWDATNFFNNDSFTFFSGWDTYNHGLTLYQPKDQAIASGLAAITNGQVYLGVDSTTTLTSTTVGPGNGRKSIRLEGVQTINNGLLIADIEHMPANVCGVWPAFWLVRDWKNSFAEIDIIEQVSLATGTWLNAYTVYDTCQMRDNGGAVTSWSTDCKLPAGCHANGPPGTFGDSFNVQKGGFWALQVESTGLRMWFFPRGSEPADLKSANPNPSSWGRPTWDLAPVNCDVNSVFANLNLIINTVLCGAVGLWESSGCGSKTGYLTCEAYVAANPAAFKDVYWLINSVKHFQDGVLPVSSSVSSSASSFVTSIRSTSSIASSASISTTSSAPASSTLVIQSTGSTPSSTFVSTTSSTPASSTLIIQPSSSALSSTFISTSSSTSGSSTLIVQPRSSIPISSSAFPSTTDSTPASSTLIVESSSSILSSVTFPTTSSILSSSTLIIQPSSSIPSSVPTADSTPSSASTTDSTLGSASTTDSTPGSSTLIIQSSSSSPSSASISTYDSMISSISEASSSAASLQPSSASSASIAEPKPTHLKTFRSHDATCGGDNGWSCQGSHWGNCCSQYGWCGHSEAYCGAGCQSSFGDCNL